MWHWNQRADLISSTNLIYLSDDELTERHVFIHGSFVSHGSRHCGVPLSVLCNQRVPTRRKLHLCLLRYTRVKIGLVRDSYAFTQLTPSYTYLCTCLI